MGNENKISQELLEAVECYLNKTMSVSELQDFENSLKNDEFKAQVEDVKITLLGIETQVLKEKLEDFHKEINTLPSKTTKVKFLNFRKFAAAAAIIIAVGSFWFFNQNSNERLYAKHFKPDPGLPTTMGSNENFKFYDGMVNYKRGDYKLAIKKWEKLLIYKPENDTLNYFVGVAFLADKNEKTSVPYLEKVIQNTNSYFKNEAFYYLGLAHLKTGNLELAKKNLEHSTINNSKDVISELDN